MLDPLRTIKLYGIRKFLTFAFFGFFNIFYMRFLKNSYSQNGEDLIIDKLLNYRKRGFYVDIGAYDPLWFSNTNRFYKKGWRGINVEPNINNYKKFTLLRPKDINLNIGIGTKKCKLTFYNFFPNTLSTFSKKDAINYEKIGFKKIGEFKVSVRRLDKIFSRYCHSKKINFLSVDTEGYEMEVLMSNNWRKYRPQVICIESFTFNNRYSQSRERKEIGNFLELTGYKRVYKNDTNIIYVDKQFSLVN